ncbi:hypothetical protein PGT21_004062 [Puccinia graminis f. sp. tritici]|uniref:Uncharacterized protein n=1 Tax=Puccinia graminis f. sp. tritici TaxID=56615 RepID=A0A5B0NMK7_PUCGR|nr:hypothetical protein PGTUg99_032340 [Puccinia graminis f. sp. tritici]KAA1090521.1 hypothetical protein PGT21_004062 [Puccinia graminis f. sp. tritici]
MVHVTRSTFLCLFLLCPTLNCTPMGFKNVAQGNEIEVAEGETVAKQNLFLKPLKNSMKSDWDALLQSTKTLEEDLKEELEGINLEKLTIPVNTIKREIEELKKCHNLVKIIFGEPGGSIQTDFEKPLHVWNDEPKDSLIKNQFEKSIWDIFDNLQIPTNEVIPESLHHIQLDCNKCAFQNLEYIERYKLLPGVHNEIQKQLRSTHGLEWFFESTRVAREGSKFHNIYSSSPYLEVQIKNHFQLTHHNNILQGLSKKEQDWIIFKCLLRRIDSEMQEAILEEEFIPDSDEDDIVTRLVLFGRKLKEFLLEDSKTGRPKDSSDFFLDVKDDLLKMRRILVNPEYTFFDDGFICGIDLLIYHFLHFLQSRLGLDPIYANIFSEDEERYKEELRRKYCLLGLAFNIEIWKAMLLDYTYYLSVSIFKVKPTEVKKSEEIQKLFYWNNLRDCFIAYKKERIKQLDEDRNWKDILESNSFYKMLVDKLDLDASKLGNLYEDIKFTTDPNRFGLFI